MLGWGLADFFAKKTIDQIGDIVVLAWAHVFGTGVLVMLGFGDAHFYPGDAYGYFSATGNVAVPLAFLPKSFGVWTANAGFTYYKSRKCDCGD